MLSHIVLLPMPSLILYIQEMFTEEKVPLICCPDASISACPGVENKLNINLFHLSY